MLPVADDDGSVLLVNVRSLQQNNLAYAHGRGDGELNQVRHGNLLPLDAGVVGVQLLQATLRP